jgi:hypothetical protein
VQRGDRLAWIGVAALSGLAYGPVVWRLAATWLTDQEYSHGLLCLPLAAALIVWVLPMNPVSAGSLALLAALAEVGIWIQLVVRYDFTRGGLQFSDQHTWFTDLHASYHVGCAYTSAAA